MGSLTIEDTMISLFRPQIKLSESRIERLARVAGGMLLAGTTELTKVARWVNQNSWQVGRVRLLERVLDADYVTQETVYQPLLKQALSFYPADVWHVVMDRSTISDDMEILAVTLNYRKRSIPLAWQLVDFGCTSAQEQIELLKHVFPLIPPSQKVVFHGDTEFGAVPVMRTVRERNWDFILAQPANTLFRVPGQPWTMLSSLPITPQHAIYLSDIEWTQIHAYGPLNLFAFYDPHQNAPFNPRRDYRYCTTTLPIAHTLRRVGHRRWGVEPFFRDYKSSGWEIEASALTNPFRMERLLVLLGINYLWSTCLGRWLCKTGRRKEVDPYPSRHLSLFRLGYDWLIHQFRMGNPCPPLLALYA